MDEGAEKPIYVLGLGGSLRRPDGSDVALRMALRGAEEAGAQTDIITADGLDLPLYPSPKMDEHPAVVRLLAAARRADGLILASPAYHGTMSGALKNALDYFQFLAHDVPPYLDGRAIGVLSTGAGTQAAVQTVNALRDVVRALRAALDDVRPDVVLNSAAYNRVDDAETDAATAFAVNAYGPRALARASSDAGAILVHYGTDYVVDGARRRPYTEEDAPLPLSAYATSKLCGEYFVRALAPRQYVLRVCGLFGQAGRHTRHGNFVETMLRAAAAGRTLRVVTDQIVAPTATRDVAAATLALVAGAAPYGLYNCTAR